MEAMWNGEFLLSQRPSSTEELRFWTEIGNGWVTYTLAVVILVSLWQFSRFQIIPRFLLFRSTFSRSAGQSNSPTITFPPSSQSHRTSDIITDLDLKLLIDNLDETTHENWEHVIDKRNNSISYHVKCCKPKDGGPLKYLSTTVFNSCSSETLRDFYMDNSYRKDWDKTISDHQQLQIDESNGTEFGRTIKKFPFLTPREYILAWRLWEGSDKTYYCYSKECEHPLAPRQKKYVRVGLLRSGWRIKEVGRNSCEIKMVHQEDAGLNVEMAKVVFAKGIWSYVCKMDNALRKYSTINRLQLTSVVSAITLIQKVPPTLECSNNSSTRNADISYPEVSQERKLSRKPSKKLIANGLLIVGGVICLARGHSNFSGKVAMAFVLSKLTKRHQRRDVSRML